MLKLLRKSVLMLGLAILLTGCAGPLLKKPDIQVSGITLGKTSLSEQDIKLDLRILNPNILPINSHGLYFELWTEGKKLATVTSDQAITIPAMGEGHVPVTVHTSLMDWLQTASVALSSTQPEVKYHIEGYLNGLDGWGRIPFSKDGSWKPH